MAPTDRYRSPRDLPERIPVFPLLGAILLPRSEMPLNVFEPRYLEMVEDAMAGSRIVGIIQPEHVGGPAESPQGKLVELKRIGCAGRITAYQELQDGRLRIVLAGVSRFVVRGEQPSDKSYRLAHVDYAPYSLDFAGDESVEAIDRPKLLKVLKAYLTARQLEVDWTAVTRAPLEPLVNSLAAMSPFGPEEKQALLEAEDTKHRAEVLMALAEMAIASGGSSGGGTLQ